MADPRQVHTTAARTRGVLRMSTKTFAQSHCCYLMTAGKAFWQAPLGWAGDGRSGRGGIEGEVCGAQHSHFVAARLLQDLRLLA